MNQEILEIVQEVLETKKVQEQIEKLDNLIMNKMIKSQRFIGFLFMH